MRRLGLLFIVIGFMLPVFAQDAVITQVLDAVNRERQSQGIPPLVLNADLIQAAQNHSNDMATNGTLTHVGSDGSQFWERIAQTGYVLSTGAENVLQRPDTNPQGVFQQWNNSAPHRANMLNQDYIEVGIAYAQASSGTYYFTMVLATRPGIFAPPVQTLPPTSTPQPVTATATATPQPSLTPTRTLMPTDVMLATVIAPLPTITVIADSNLRGFTLATMVVPLSTNTPAPTSVAAINNITTNTPIPTPTTPDIRLVYSPTSFALINVSGRPLNLTGLSFESASGTFAAIDWNTDFLTQPLSGFTADDCLQIWGFSEVTQVKPDDCRFRHAWVQVDENALFWTGTDTFIVQNGEQTVAVCSVEAGICEVNLSAPITEPTPALPEPVSATQSAADLRLVYDNNTLSLVNVSGRVLNLSGITFRSSSGVMTIERWNTDSLSQSLSGFTANDCLQVWGLEASDLYPKPDECEVRHSWIAVGDEFDFWRDTDIFIVERNNRRIGLCDVSLGSCDISLSADFGTVSTTTNQNPDTGSSFADVRLIITETSITLVNFSSSSIDVSGLVVESDSGVFAASRWDTEFLSRPLNDLPAGDCLQIWLVGGQFEVQPSECSTRHAWVAVRPDEQFWRNVNIFRVRWSEQVLTSCETRVRTCDFNLP